MPRSWVGKLDCGDNSCRFALNKTGMRTNGGCSCIENLVYEREGALEDKAIADAQLARVTAEAAVMREVLQMLADGLDGMEHHQECPRHNCVDMQDCDEGCTEHWCDCTLRSDDIAHALSPDTGKALLERMRKLEAVADAARQLRDAMKAMTPGGSEVVAVDEALRALDEEVK